MRLTNRTRINHAPIVPIGRRCRGCEPFDVRTRTFQRKSQALLWWFGAAMKLLLDGTREKLALAVFLALVAGYLDGYGLLVLGTYVSFMSGNTTITGLRSGQNNFHAALPPAIAVLSFVTGSFLGNLFSQSRLRYSHRLIFGVIAALLATVASLEQHGLWNAPAEIALLSLAMGMMNPAFSKVGAESVSLTFVTGTLNRIGGHLAAAAGRKPLEGQGSGDSHLARARIDASVWSGFLVGAGLSGMAGAHFRVWALLPPCVVMIALGLFSESATPSPEKRITSSISGGAKRSLAR
jgi:uncharacterized membrane protein YoaK (UPF0700 family)